jgi:FMN reductase (NADPH)
MNKEHLSETIKIIQNHRSFRKFKQDDIPNEHVNELIKSGQSAASSSFVQAYSVIQIKDKAKKEKISVLAGNQKQVSECPLFLLFCADLKRLEYACKKEGIEMQYDTALMAQNVLTAAESLGYGGCYIGGIRNNPKQISELVNLPDKVFPLFGLTLGIPDEEVEVKPRLPLALILHEETYQEDHYGQLLDQYDETMKSYYQSRTSNNKNTGWTNTMAKMFSEKRRVHIKGFLESKGFNLK